MSSILSRIQFHIQSHNPINGRWWDSEATNKYALLDVYTRTVIKKYAVITVRLTWFTDLSAMVD